MDTANVNDPKSLEAIYPRDAFEREARLNAQDKTTVHHGLKILSAPDENGNFSLTRANQHVGETQAASHSLFLCPLLPASEQDEFIQSEGYGGPVERRDPPQDRGDPYRSFLEEVIRAAKSADFPPTDGAERLKGFHGG
jgi:hypothetical protein